MLFCTPSCPGGQNPVVRHVVFSVAGCFPKLFRRIKAFRCWYVWFGVLSNYFAPKWKKILDKVKREDKTGGCCKKVQFFAVYSATIVSCVDFSSLHAWTLWRKQPFHLPADTLSSAILDTDTGGSCSIRNRYTEQNSFKKLNFQSRELNNTWEIGVWFWEYLR